MKDSISTGEKGTSGVNTLTCITCLPPKVMLTVTRTRMQIIDLICEDLTSHNDDVSQHKLVLTGSHIVSVDDSGVITKRQDMKTTQEEAANMIIQQDVAEVKANLAKEVLVVVDDTDICVRLLHICCQGGIPTLTCLNGFVSD